MTEEIWVQSPDYPRYDVSSLGRVRRRDNGRLLTPRTWHTGPGRLVVNVCNAWHRHRWVSLPRLVMAAHGTEQMTGYRVVCYRDGNRQNCAISNLYMGTPGEYVKESWKRGVFDKRKVTWWGNGLKTIFENRRRATDLIPKGGE